MIAKEILDRIAEYDTASRERFSISYQDWEAREKEAEGLKTEVNNKGWSIVIDLAKLRFNKRLRIHL